MAFDGDNLIKLEFEKLVKQYKIQTIIETGTYLGETTVEFTKMVPNVWTIESSTENLEKAQEKLSNYVNVLCILGHSEQVLPELLQNKSIVRPLMFYLDAHWEDYNPLRDELVVISSSAKDSVIAIHDFKVPNHPELGFDYYPILENGIKKGYYPLCFELIQDILQYCYTKGYRYYYNDKADCENKRGIIYICPL